MSKIFFYQQTNRIELYDNGRIIISLPEETLDVNEKGKPLFSNDTGESIVELTGLSSDGKESRSFAIARYEPNGYSKLHYHSKRTENYYVTQGQAKVIINRTIHILNPGDTITISPGEHHQVISIGAENLEMLVRCTPAWIFEDQHFVPNVPEASQ